MSLQIINENRQVVARKDHKCSFCHGTIPKGSTYDKQVLKYDDLYTWKSHTRCSKIASELRMYDECTDYGLTSDDFHEFINSEFYKLFGNETDPDFQVKLEWVCLHHLGDEGKV